MQSHSIGPSRGGRVLGVVDLRFPAHSRRVNATAKALECQLQLASQLGERLGEVSAALQQANGLRKQIEERKKDAAGKTEILTALEELNQRTEAAAEPEGEDDYFMLFGLALPAEEQEPLPRVEFALTGLFVVTESADVAPASDLRKAAEAWDVASKNALARWRLVMENDLMGVNAKLRKAKLRPLAVK